MEQIAATSTANILSRYSQEYVLDSLRSMGYTKGVDDIKQYYIDSQKQEILVKDYILANQDKYLKDELGTDGRIIYHILVKCDVTPVTDEEGNVTKVHRLGGRNGDVQSQGIIPVSDGVAELLTIVAEATMALDVRIGNPACIAE